MGKSDEARLESAGLRSWELDLRDEVECVDFVRRAIKHGTERLEPWYQQASLNLAYCAGQHHVFKTKAGMVPDPRISKEVDYRRPASYMNWCRKVLIAWMVRIYDGRISFRGRPRMTDDERIIAAAEALGPGMEFWWQTMMLGDMDNVWRGLYFFCATGLTHAHVQWHRNENPANTYTDAELHAELLKFAKTKLADNEALQGEDLLNMFATEVLGTHPLNLQQRADGQGWVVVDGEPKIIFHSGFDVIEDLTAPQLPWNARRWVILRTYDSVAAVRERYGAKADHVVGRYVHPDDLAMGYRQQLDNALSGGEIFEGTEVDIIYHRPTGPNGMYPRGYVAHVCEEGVLEHGENPAWSRSISPYPVVRYAANPDPWGDTLQGDGYRPSCVMSDVRNRNYSYNLVVQQTEAHIGRTADPDLMVPKGSIDKKRFMVVRPGFQEYNVQIGEPHYIEMPQMAAHVVQHRAMVGEEIKLLGSLNDPTQGRPTSQAKSGVAIQALQSRDDQQMIMMVDGFAAGLAQTGTLIAALHYQYTSQKRRLDLPGDDVGSRRTVELFSRDLFSGGDGRTMLQMFDLTVEIEARPSEEQVLQRVAAYLQMGLANPIVDRDTILDAIRRRDVSGIDPTRQDRIRARRENRYMQMFDDMVKAGALSLEAVYELWPNVIYLQLGDDPNAHSDIHLDALKEHGERWEVGIRQLAVEHVAEHGRTFMAAQGVLPDQQQNPAGPGAAGSPPPAGGNRGPGAATRPKVGQKPKPRLQLAGAA